MRLLAICFCFAVLYSSTALAQRQGNARGATGGSGGLFGSRNMGGSFQAGNRTFRGGSAAAGGQGGMGQGGAAVAGNGAGQLTGSERFIRGNRQPGQFVGGDAQSQGFVGAAGGQAGVGQGGRGGMGMGGMGPGLGGFNQFGGLGGLGLPGFGQNAFGAQGGRGNRGQRGVGGRNNQIRYRTTMRVGFEPPARPVGVTSAQVAVRLQKSSQLNWVSPVQVQLVDRTAILRGTVATEHERALAEQVVLLEPGVSQVQNEIRLAAPAGNQ